jgi:hypothetical protein
MRLFIVLFMLVSAQSGAQECADLKTVGAESFGRIFGLRDSFVHLEIHDRTWAKTIFGAALDGESGWDVFVTEVVDGKLNIYMHGAKISYFDLPNARLGDEKENGREIRLSVGNGTVFILKYSYEMRRRVELWVDGLTGPQKSRKILTAISGMEFEL